MKNNKGFSLVELIIVIAIMAILAGALAPALIKYINKSRRSTDVSNAQTIATAVTTALSVENAYDAATPGTYTVSSDFKNNSSDAFRSEVSDSLSNKEINPKYEHGSNFIVTLDSDMKNFTITISGSGAEVYPDVDSSYK